MQANPFRPAEEASVSTTLSTRCLGQTLAALARVGLADQPTLELIYAECLEKIKFGQPEDPLVALARLRGTDEEFMGPVIQRFSAALAMGMSPAPPLLPFAHRLIAPNSFYELFPTLVELGKQLLVPVVFAEDTDAIGVASINPFAAEFFSREIISTVHKRFSVRPFVTVVRTDYEGWSFLVRKHYML
jgi:hypothetical protein